jgi:lipoprotein-anchoring transpeptidase ErfK/SrfK
VLVTFAVAIAALVTPSMSASAAVGTPIVGATVASVAPAAGSTVGVAHPIIVTFTGPVAEANRAAAERGIKVISPTDIDGHFEWTSDNVVQWLPAVDWPAHSTVKLSVGNMPLDFNVGSSVSAVASISGHSFTVSIDGEVARRMPASMGKPKFPTPQGTFTVLGKESPVVMDSRTIGIPLDDPEGYKLTVYYAVRITWGGVYVHSAPWSVGSQGYSNVSHGCINLSPDNAAWYYNNVGIGDRVTVKA